MVLRVKSTPTRFPTNILSTPKDSTPLHSMASVWCPRGLLLLLLILLLRQGAKSSPEGHSRIVLGYFTLTTLLLYPRHVIVMRLHWCDVSTVVILIPETVDLLGL